MQERAPAGAAPAAQTKRRAGETRRAAVRFMQTSKMLHHVRHNGRGGLDILGNAEIPHHQYLVPGLVDDLLGWLRTSDEHPLILGCVFHHWFEFIHPFSDGNGRTGRLWHMRILQSWRPEFAWIPVEASVLKHRWDYYDAIQESDESGDSERFIGFMLEVVSEAVDGVLDRA